MRAAALRATADLPSPLRRAAGRAGAGLLAAAALVVPAAAAPLDPLLTATPERAAARAGIELGLDHLTRALDFSTVREGDTPLPGARKGDYQGLHATATWRAAEGLWLSGGLWQRRIDGDQDSYHYRSWLLSGLVRFTDAQGARPALALRLAGWGDSATRTVTTTPVHVLGAVLDSVTVTRPSDRTLQADLLATWALTPSWDLTAQLGLGRTRLAYGALAATTTRNGCLYDLSFNGNDIFGNLAAPCSAGSGVIRQFYDSSGDYGVDVANEIAWHGRFAQLGVNAAWREGPWSFAAGLLFHFADRNAVDAILAARGEPAHKRNRIVMLDGGYALGAHLGLFTRLQLGSNLFLDEIPVTYNTSTASSFGNHFSLLSLGLRATF